MTNLNQTVKSLERLTQWIKYVLYAQIVIAIFSIIFGFLEFRLLATYQEGFYASLEEAFADGELVIQSLQVTGIVSLIAFIASAILILKWIYRANHNARQLGAQSMSHTPAWSIGYYFIPIFNLWKPYLALKEIWMTSKSPLDWRYPKVSITLPIWWTLWLSSNILNQSIFRLSASAETLPELMKLNILSQVSNIMDIPLAIVTLIIIKNIYKMQTHCMSKI
ncbi:DUF4328 domain-containing protein [Vibrio sp. 2-Bac 85]